jgi:ribose/xylose/arabinose/galactoside ABC-type transport system permease subunit
MRATGSNFDFSVGRMIGACAPIVVPLFVAPLGGLGLAMGTGVLIGAVLYVIAVIGLKETKGTVITPTS